MLRTGSKESRNYFRRRYFAADRLARRPIGLLRLLLSHGRACGDFRTNTLTSIGWRVRLIGTREIYYAADTVRNF